VPLTTRAPGRQIPYIVELRPPEGALPKVSFALCDQVTRIDKMRVEKRTGGICSHEAMERIDAALRLVLDL